MTEEDFNSREERPVKSSEDKNPLWDALGREAIETFPAPKGPSVAGLSQNPTLADRFAARLSSGTLLLYLVCLFALALVGFDGLVSPLILAPIITLFFCWLLAPLTGSRQGMNSGCLIACFIPALGYAFLARAIPLQLEPEPLRSFAGELQIALETTCQPSTAIIIALCALFSLVLVHHFQNRSPWVDTTTPYSAIRKALAWACLVLPLFFLGYVLSGIQKSKDVQEWLAKTASIYENYPSVVLPNEVKSPGWADLLEETETEINELSESNAEKRTHLVTRYLELCRKGLPESRSLLKRTKTHLYSLLTGDPELHHSAETAELGYYFLLYSSTERPDALHYILNEGVVVDAILPYLTSPELSEAELLTWQEHINTLKGLAPSKENELDLYAYEKLGITENLQFKAFPYGNEKFGGVPLEANPMKLFGKNVTPSITEIELLRLQSLVLEDWLLLKAKLSPLSRQQRHRFLEELTDPLGGTGQFPYLESSGLLGDLNFSNHYHRDFAELNQIGFLIQLRLAKLRSGSYPSSLDGIDDLRTNWDWEKTATGWTLKKSYDDTRSWQLP